MKIETSTNTEGYEKPHIDEGMYNAELKEVKDISDGQYGQRVAFVYRIIDKDTELAYVCYKSKATVDNKLGKALIAHGLEINNKEVDTDSLIGSKVRVLVEDYHYKDDSDGKDKVASIISKVKPLTEKV